MSDNHAIASHATASHATAAASAAGTNESAAERLALAPAWELASRIARGELSAREVMRMYLERIAAINPLVNAIVTQLPAERAMSLAAKADERQAQGETLGPLHGLPIAHKDLVDTQGMRTTYGSPLYREHIPEQDDMLVERLRAAGALSIGKTNTPEFGAGSQTFNRVFGVTRNPYNTQRTCGGSSGGAAVALACGMLPVADGSDMGGSLRNPAGFCNVVGFRVSAGRVPSWPNLHPWANLTVQGPMGRTVRDVALLLSAMAGPDARSPIGIAEAGARFRQPLERDFRGVRVAWCPQLDGLSVESPVLEVLQARRQVFQDLGCEVEEAAPSFADADEIFQILRAQGMESRLGELYTQHPQAFKDTLAWNIERGRALSGPQLSAAERKRGALYHRMRKFLESYEFLICTTNQVEPFAVEADWVREIEGEPMRTYIDWMRSCWYITLTGLPAISVPCGFTAAGHPVGLQIVGRFQADFSVLQLAHAFEQANPCWRKHPPCALTTRSV